MEEKFSDLMNQLWSECIQNLSKTLEAGEQDKFSNNDYYYLLVIQSLEKPNFSTIADKLKITKPAVTAIIRKLSGMNLVEKTQSETDKRVYQVELTDKGKNILNGDKEVFKWLSDTITQICRNEEELEIINRVIGSLVERLGVR